MCPRLPSALFLHSSQDCLVTKALPKMTEVEREIALQALFSNFGYTYLDVRPKLELEEVGKVKGCVNVPIMHAIRKYSSEKQKKVLQKEDNPDFVSEVC